MTAKVALSALWVVCTGTISPTYAADGQPSQSLALEVLFERPEAGAAGDLVVMPNGDLLAVSIFARSFTRFDAHGRVLWERSHSGGQPRHTVGVPGGGFVSVGVKQASPVSVFPPGWAIKGNFDVWVGRFDDDGALLWESTFGDLQLEMGQSVAAFEDGSVTIAGDIENRETWLIKLGPQGRMTMGRWRRGLRFGGGKSAVLALPNGDAAVVSQVPEYQEGSCRAAFDITPVKIWRFDRYGALRGVVTARDHMVGSSAGCNWNFQLLADSTSSETVFVLSSLRGHRMSVDVEVAKVDLEQGRLWAQPVDHAQPELEYAGCYHAIAVMPNGNAVVACSNRNGIDIVALDGADGRPSRYRVDAPDCDHEPQVAELFRPRVYLAALPDGRLALAGADRWRVGDCSWLAVFSLPTN